jgi:hypothetical protein
LISTPSRPANFIARVAYSEALNDERNVDKLPPKVKAAKEIRA